MCQKFTPDELNKMDHQSKNDVIYQMQDRLDKLEHDYENLIEQIRLANTLRLWPNQLYTFFYAKIESEY